MKKITFLLTLFLLFAGVGVAQTAAKYYKPGERKTAFAAGDKVFIYNAARPGGDRTGLLRKTSANKVGFYRDCKPGAGLFSTENSGLIWEIKSVTAVEDAENVYELTIASVPGGQYIGIDGNTTYEAGQTLTVQTFFNYEHKGNGNFEAADGTVVTPTADNKDVWAVYDPERRKTDYEGNGQHHGCWNGNGTQFDEWEAAHPYVFYTISEAESDLTSALATYNTQLSELREKLPNFDENMRATIESVIATTTDYLSSDICTVTGIENITSKVTNLNSLESLPFELSTAENPKYYTIGTGRNANSVFNLLYDINKGGTHGRVNLVNNATPAANACQYWFFTLSENGYIRISPMVNPGVTLGYSAVSNGADKIVTTGTVAGDEYEFVSVTTSFNGKVSNAAFRIPGTIFYLSNWGGPSNRMGVWNGDGNESNIASDGGSCFRVEAVETPANVDQVKSLYAALDPLPAGASFGENYGQFIRQNNEVYNAGVTALQNITTADLSSILSSFEANPVIKQILPVTGKFYRFKGNANNKYMSSVENTNHKLPLVDAGSTAETVFYWDAEKHLVALTNGYCVGKFAPGEENVSWTVLPIANAKVGNVELIANTAAYGTFNIMASSNRYLHNGGGASVNVGGATGDGYRWIIEDVTWLPVKINTTVGYATLYSPVALGKGYSADRVKAYAGVVNENGEYLELNEITGDIPANTPVVLEYLAEAENGFVFLPVRESVEAYSGDNDLKGVVATQSKTAGVDVYTLQNIGGEPGFYLFTGDNLGGFKSYLELPEGTTLANGLRFNGDVTGVGNVEAAGQEKKEVFYDLNGRLVAYPAKGIYVTGSGKKVLFK